MPKNRPLPLRPRMRQAGFTLIELMITIVILVIISSIAVPGLKGMVVRNRVYSVSSDLTVDLQFARNEAFRREKRVQVCQANSTLDNCDTNSGGSFANGWLVFVDANSNNGYDSGEEVIRVHQPVSSGITISVSPSATRAYYRPIGMVDAAHTFTVCQSGYEGRVITVSVTGRTTVAPQTTCS